MHKFLLILSFISLVITTSTIAQTKTFTMEEAIIGYTKGLYPESIYGKWQPGSPYFIYKDGNSIIQLHAKNNSVEELFSLSSINEKLSAMDEDTLKYLPFPQWINEQRFLLKAGQKCYIIAATDLNINHIIELADKDANLDFTEFDEELKIAVTNQNSLFIVSPEKRKEVASSDSDELVYGSDVSRREFGISKGTFWSPDARYLAYYIKDNSNVKQYPLVDITTREAEPDLIRYPMAGMASEQVWLGVYNIENGKHIYIEKDNAATEQYLTNITWGPESKFIYIQVLNREQNHMKLNKYNATTGELVSTLFEEKHDKYVEPYHTLNFAPKSNESFFYQSRRNGYNHIYHYTTDGELIQQITDGPWEVTSFLGFDEKGKNIFYTSTEVSAIERHTYKVNISKPNKKIQLTEKPGTHRVSLSDGGQYIFDRFQSTDVPGVMQVISTAKGKKQIIKTAENPLKEYNMGKMTIGTIKAADDSTNLYYRLIKPINFDPGKKYPAIVYVYGGPHAQLINNTWLGGAQMWQHFMAQQGYVMLTVDNRGSANRGLEFENIIHNYCGKHEMEDQLRGIQLLQNLNYVDTARIGVHGWSYGGFMTTSLLTNHSDVFKVGVAGGPVIDWKYYEIMYGERYMSSPENNPDGYEATSLLKMAPKLKRKLLIIHGYIDPTVVPQHSLQFVRECVKNNIPVDFFMYPRAEHNVRGKDRIHLMQKVTDYFDDYLK
ncbi:MAG: DPP IV N-terminal domain-containing protein [Salinivirgaceae bacterium]